MSGITATVRAVSRSKTTGRTALTLVSWLTAVFVHCRYLIFHFCFLPMVKRSRKLPWNESKLCCPNSPIRSDCVLVLSSAVAMVLPMCSTTPRRRTSGMRKWLRTVSRFWSIPKLNWHFWERKWISWKTNLAPSLCSTTRMWKGRVAVVKVLPSELFDCQFDGFEMFFFFSCNHVDWSLTLLEMFFRCWTTHIESVVQNVCVCLCTRTSRWTVSLFFWFLVWFDFVNNLPPSKIFQL